MASACPAALHAPGGCLAPGCPLPHDARALAAVPICRYSLRGACAFGDRCRYAHGAPCPHCHGPVLHPHSAQDRARHLQACPARPEGPQKADAECNICFEPVLAGGNLFGLLEACQHVFCLPCLRRWRRPDTPAPSASPLVLRSCPACRELSLFVVPSHTLPCSADDKKRIVEAYRRSRARIPCRHFSRSGGQGCPFGDECFYAHPDGNGGRAKLGSAKVRADAGPRQQGRGGGVQGLLGVLDAWEGLELLRALGGMTVSLVEDGERGELEEAVRRSGEDVGGPGRTARTTFSPGAPLPLPSAPPARRRLPPPPPATAPHPAPARDECPEDEPPREAPHPYAPIPYLAYFGRHPDPAELEVNPFTRITMGARPGARRGGRGGEAPPLVRLDWA